MSADTTIIGREEGDGVAMAGPNGGVNRKKRTPPSAVGEATVESAP